MDMSPIEIEESVDGATYTEITDKAVLDQLTGLKTFIGKSGMIKPIWIKLLNGETDELIVTRGSLSAVDSNIFEICVPLDGYKLKISVEFTQMLNEDDEPLNDWYIDGGDAKYILVSDTQSVASIIGTGEIDNAKPIYCHPIEMYKTGVGTLCCLIFNNSSEPIDNWAKVKEAIHSFGGDDYNRLLVSGSFTDINESKLIIASEIIEDIRNSTYGLYGLAVDGTSYLETPLDITSMTFNSVTDGVNKIN